MICKLCEKDGKLIKAHIIPESLWPHRKSGGKQKVYSSLNKYYPKRSPKGIYDHTILCEHCEKLFSPWDDYAQSLLLTDIEGNYIIEHAKKVCFEIKDYDYSKLKLFFTSLLWRASVSTHEFFKDVKVDKFENQLRKMIIENDPGDEDSFSVTLGRWDDAAINEGIGLGILSPWKRRFYGINYYSFYFGFGFLAFIKVDRRPVPPLVRRGILRPNKPLYIYIFELSGSEEIKHIHKISEAQKIKNVFCPFGVRSAKR
jgi:hypothetical protein